MNYTNNISGSSTSTIRHSTPTSTMTSETCHPEHHGGRAQGVGRGHSRSDQINISLKLSIKTLSNPMTF